MKERIEYNDGDLHVVYERREDGLWSAFAQLIRVSMGVHSFPLARVHGKKGQTRADVQDLLQQEITKFCIRLTTSEALHYE